MRTRVSSRAITVLAVLLMLAAVPEGLPAATSDDNPERWLTYKELRGKLRVGGADREGELGPLLTNISSNVEVEGDFVLKRGKIDTYWGKVTFNGQLTGKIGYRSSMQGASTENFESDFSSACSSAIGSDSEVELVVDYRDGKYTLSAWANGKCATNRLHMEAEGTATDAEMGDVLATINLPFEVLLNGGLELPKSGKAITASVPVLLQAGLTPPFQGLGKWWIETDPAETEVSVTVKEPYGDWTPTKAIGEANPVVPGSPLEITVKVYRKDDPTTPVPATLRFTLQRVSRERGICLNWPAENANTDPDLRLEFKDNALGIPSDDGTSIQTKVQVKELVLLVKPYDFGAWGTLQVSGTDVNDRPVSVKVRKKETSELYIPLDEDQNHIADGWNRDKTWNKPPDTDDEHEPGNDHDGDGLTLYEEYRGFWTGGKYTKGSLDSKDFFIRNMIGAQADAGITQFKNATGLVVHRNFSLEELPEDRVINRYSSAEHRQHGVVLEWYPEEADKGYSEAVGGPGPPGKVSKILISKRWLKRLEYEVAHELLHACNVAHHGEGDREVRWKTAIEIGVFKEEPMGASAKMSTRIEPFSMDGKPLDWANVRNLGGELDVWIPVDGGQHSGAEHCLMRYAHERVARIDEPGSVIRRLTSAGKLGTVVCETPDGTGINATEKGWGRAADGRGNCFGQIHVNDRIPAEPRAPQSEQGVH